MNKNKLHPGAKWVFRIRSYWGFFFLAFFIGMWAFLILRGLDLLSDSILSYVLFMGILIISLIIIFGEIYARMAYKRWFYEFTPTNLKIEKGIIHKSYKSIPYERIQNVDINRGILARILGFSSVSIQTAGYSGHGRGIGAEGHLPALSIKAAEKIREFLMKKISRKHHSQGL
jgi:putative membrane protein